MPCYRKPISTVITFATQYRHKLAFKWREFHLQKLDDAQRGVFHEDDAGDAVLLGRGFVEVAHLLGGEHFHNF